jgi:hypothetical protein
MKKVELKINENDILKYVECGIKAIVDRNTAKRKNIFVDISHAIAAGSKEQLHKSFRDLKNADKNLTEELESLNSLIDLMEGTEILPSDT